MALLDAHGNPIAAPNPGPAPAQLIDVNQLKTAFGNPKADIPIFYGDASLDNVSAKFLLEILVRLITSFRVTMRMV